MDKNRDQKLTISKFYQRGLKRVMLTSFTRTSMIYLSTFGTGAVIVYSEKGRVHFELWSFFYIWNKLSDSNEFLCKLNTVHNDGYLTQNKNLFVTVLFDFRK